MGDEEAREDLRPPKYDPRFAYLLSDFEELDRRRQVGEQGELPLTWGDCESWARATGRNVTAWEWKVIGRIDDAYFFAKAKPKRDRDDD